MARERTAAELIDMVWGHLEVLIARRTFGYFTGEMATSLFALPYAHTPLNRVMQGLLAPVCRLLTLADPWEIETVRYAVAILARRRGGPQSQSAAPPRHEAPARASRPRTETA